MKGYKVFYHDLTCRPTPEVQFQYEVGKTYEMDEPPVICQRGFHYWEFPYDVFNLHTASFDARVCEIEATGEIVNDGLKRGVKYATNRIRIVYELHPAEIVDAMLAAHILPVLTKQAAFDILMKDIAKHVRLYLELGRDFMLTGNEVVMFLPHAQRAFIEDRAYEWKAVLEAKGYEV